MTNVSSHPATVITDNLGRVQWVNEAFTELCGYSIKDIEGFTPGSVLQGAATDPATVQEIRTSIDCQRPFSGQLINYHANGEPYQANLDIVPVFDKRGELTAFLGFAERVVERNQTVVTPSLETAAEDDPNITVLVNQLIDLSASIAEAEYGFLLHPSLSWGSRSVPPAIVRFCEPLLHDEPLLIDDLQIYPELSDGAHPPIRFLASLPLPQIGGALCIADRQPKILAPFQTEQLRLSADCLAHALQFSLSHS